MTFRGRSDGLLVESDKKLNISFSRRQCVAPITLWTSRPCFRPSLTNITQHHFNAQHRLSSTATQIQQKSRQAGSEVISKQIFEILTWPSVVQGVVICSFIPKPTGG